MDARLKGGHDELSSCAQRTLSRAVEERMRDAGVADLASAGLDRLEAAWQEVKAQEKRER